MAIRLTKQLRERILFELLKDKFKDKEAEIEKKKINLANQIYESKYSQAERDLMTSLPIGWLEVRTGIYASLGGEFLQFEFEKNSPKRYPHSQGHACLIKEDTGKLTKAYQHIKSLIENLKDERGLLREKINSILYSAKSDKRLREIWPEISIVLDLVCEKIPQPLATIPKKLISDLNSQLNLKD